MNKTLIAGMVAGLFALPAWAAQVPAGTKLLPDAQQIYVTNIGTEPTTIDPQLVEESAGSEIVNDLFEGSTYWIAKARPSPLAPSATRSTRPVPSTPSS